MKAFAAIAALLFAASRAGAQTIELSPLASIGYTTAAEIDRKAAGVRGLAIGGGFTWGAQAGYFFSDRLGVDVIWMQQFNNLTMTTSSGSASLFAMKVGVLHGNVVYRIRSRGAWQPFVFAGLGSTFFTADGLDPETKLSFGAGGGLKWFPSRHVGARVHARLEPTHLDASSSAYCNPFGFCQGWLTQFDVAGGLVLRF